MASFDLVIFDWDAPYEHWYRDAFERELRPVPGIQETLDHLEIPTCVASSGTHEKMRRTLGMTGLRERFTGRIFSATQVRNGKPAPDLFLLAAATAGVTPSSCAVVEDSVHGVSAAQAAGMHVFAYAGGVTCARHLEGDGTTVFEDIRELPHLLEAGQRTR